MKRFIGFLILATIGVLALGGCSQQYSAKHFGGKMEESLAPGQKLIGATWEQENLWYITRPRRDGEVAETITLTESSSFGVFQGTIVVHER